MRISDIIAICWRNLTRRKLRTVLTAFGVVIGVCAILIMISIGLGLEAFFTAQLASWGDLTMIEVNNYGGTQTLDDAAIAKIQKMDGVQMATPFFQSWELPLRVKTKNGRYEATYMNVYGVYPEALEMMGWELESGRYLEKGDKEYSLVVGSQFAYSFRDTRKKPGRNDRIDPWPDPVTGKVKDPYVNVLKDKFVMTMKPNKENAKDIEMTPVIAGVLKKNDQNWETANGVFMDITEMKALIQKFNKASGITKQEKTKYDTVKVKCFDMNQVAAVQAEIESMGFNCWSMESNRKSMQDQMRMIQLVLGGLAAISLFVAAIGIANTMVMSIIERTREIGIMKVIGAEIGNIRTMFLMEAGMIGLLGGIVGVILSFVASFVINKFAGGMMGGPGTQISIIPPWLVLFALLFSMLIGIIFGFLPANRAVKISALEAIKHD